MVYQGIAWVGVYVEDMHASIAFYKNVLGLPLLGQGDDYAHFRVGKGALLELMSGGKTSRRPKNPDQQSIVIGLLVENLDDSIRELKQKGVNFIGEIGEYKNSRWAHFTDPEGNQLEIKALHSSQGS